jgi:hypothetical protein
MRFFSMEQEVVGALTKQGQVHKRLGLFTHFFLSRLEGMGTEALP